MDFGNYYIAAGSAFRRADEKKLSRIVKELSAVIGICALDTASFASAGVYDGGLEECLTDSMRDTLELCCLIRMTASYLEAALEAKGGRFGPEKEEK